QVMAAVGQEFLGKKIRYVVQEELLGTGHALSQCKDVLCGRFLVLMADDLYRREDMEKLTKCPLALLAYELPAATPGNNSWAEIKLNANGSVSEILERQPGRAGMLVNCGAYVLDMRYFELPLKPAGNQTAEFGLPQTMMQMVKSGAEIDIVRASWWHRVTAPADLSLEKKAA
ncbi:MAG: hypothetical protein M1275_00775, partial [Patescibacteria group bacterium]|nr:hypothetical protein [Patescibacteria group bacterium]